MILEGEVNCLEGEIIERRICVFGAESALLD